MVLFRVSGTRSLAQLTTFDFMLLLVIIEATRVRQDPERMDQITTAVLERTGESSIIPDRRP